MKEEIMNCIVCDITHKGNNQYYGEIYRVLSDPSLGGYKSLLIRCESNHSLDKEVAIDVSDSISDTKLKEIVSCWVRQELLLDQTQLNIVAFEMRPRQHFRPSVIIAIIGILTSCYVYAANTEVIDGIEWTVSAAGDVKPVDKTKISGEVVVPSSVNGIAVKKISDSAFYGCTNLIEVVLPKSVEEIEARAFYGCSRLESVDLSCVRHIKPWAFYATALRQVIFPSTVEYISANSFAESYSFSGSTYWYVCGLSKVAILGEWFEEPEGNNEYLFAGYLSPSPIIYASEDKFSKVHTNMYRNKRLSSNLSWCCYPSQPQLKIGWSVLSFEPSDSIVTPNTMIQILSNSTNKNTKVYYTVDGTMPTNCVTEHCHLYSGPIAITGKTNVKAVSYVDPDSIYAEVLSIEYAFGAVEQPSIEASQGYCFDASNNIITISTATEGAEIRYTTDGTEPTETSQLYKTPLVISETTIIKTKAFKEDWLDSETATATFTREWYTVEQPVIEPSGMAFGNVSQEVSISCETDGATILYTTDGSDPAVNGREYKHPFGIYQSCTVRAIARKYDWKDSAEVTATFTRSESLSAAANFYGYTMETDGSHPWTVVTDVSHDGVLSVQSGTIGNNETTWLQSSIKKAGTVSFWWRAACEEADEEEGNDGYYDYGAFLVDDVVVARIAGHDGGWRYVSHEIAGGGKHTLRWEYRKDGATSYAPDCIWVDQVQWVPADDSGYTLTTPEQVPYSWLTKFGFDGKGIDFETAAAGLSGKTQGGKATRLWEEFVAGTNPTNETSVFTAKIEMKDGEPVVTWEPNLNTNSIERLYKVYGKETLSPAEEWAYPTNSLHRFFKVTVEMP